MKKIRQENWITENDAELLVQLQKTYYNLNSVHDDIPNKFDNGAISNAMDSCMQTITEILSKYVCILELNRYMDASQISEYIWKNSLDCYPDAEAFQQLVLDLIWYELKCIDHNEIAIFGDEENLYPENSIITLSDAYMMRVDGIKLDLEESTSNLMRSDYEASIKLEKLLKEMYGWDISNLNVIAQQDKFSNVTWIQVNHYWWLAEDLSHYSNKRTWR
jgi:hypothetical protein